MCIRRKRAEKKQWKNSLVLPDRPSGTSLSSRLFSIADLMARSTDGDIRIGGSPAPNTKTIHKSVQISTQKQYTNQYTKTAHKSVHKNIT